MVNRFPNPYLNQYVFLFFFFIFDHERVVGVE